MYSRFQEVIQEVELESRTYYYMKWYMLLSGLVVLQLV